MAKNQKMSQSDFYCTKCGKKGLPIFRKSGKLRADRHLKKLYCIYCGEEVNHAEVRDTSEYGYEDFLAEFNAGLFKNGKRKFN